MKREDPEFTGWRTSSFSGGDNNCVEVAFSTDGRAVGVRDSKDRRLAPHVFTADEWAAFLAGVGRGEFGGPGSDVAGR